MGFFDDEKNVNDYIQMAAGYDGAGLIQKLQNYLAAGSNILEIGMGPGVDLDILKKTYRVTGSDLSKVFIEKYKRNNPDADLLQMDAVTLKTDRKFDAIYSNKVLHHLETADLKKSLLRQLELLNPDGIAMHSFWHGDKREMHHGLLFVYYTAQQIQNILPGDFVILEQQVYSELEKDDSIYFILQRNSQ